MVSVLPPPVPDGPVPALVQGEHACANRLEGGRTADATVEVEEQREVLQLLSDDEADGGEHGHAAVRDLRLPPPADLLDALELAQVLRDPRESLSLPAEGRQLSRVEAA